MFYANKTWLEKSLFFKRQGYNYEIMRYTLTKQNSTKTERIVYEVLKEMKVPFKHRWIISGKEIDFIIGNYALEINGHNQNTDKNELLASLGYIPIHIDNSEVNVEYIKNLINRLK